MHGLWLPNETVRTFLQERAHRLQSLPFVMVTSMDSDRRPGLMPWARRRVLSEASWAISTAPLVLHGSGIVDLLDDSNLFTGFDEVWIPASADGAEPPPAAFLVAPRRLEYALPASIEQWALASGARLGLGDGDGLNIVVADPGLALGLGLDASS